MSEPKSEKWIKPVVVIGVIAALGGAWVLADRRMEGKSRDRMKTALASPGGIMRGDDYNDRLDLAVPEFQLENIRGGVTTRETLAGQVWVVDFMFTHCAGICPQMTEMMQLLHDRLKDLPQVRYVSISVDPERDTAAHLREYAEQYGADPERWLFLRGDKADVNRLAAEGFLLGDLKNPLNHSPKFALVDGIGKIRGFYDGAGPERASDIKSLEADIRELVIEAEAGR